MTFLEHIAISILGVSLMMTSTGCSIRFVSQKERSFDTAIQILERPHDRCIFDKINELSDVDALRIIAFASRATTWAMEAGSDVQFDNRLEELSLAAMHRLFIIDSEKAKDAIEGYERAFVVDGALSLSFKKWEEEARKRRESAPEMDAPVKNVSPCR